MLTCCKLYSYHIHYYFFKQFLIDKIDCDIPWYQVMKVSFSRNCKKFGLKLPLPSLFLPPPHKLIMLNTSVDSTRDLL